MLLEGGSACSVRVGGMLHELLERASHLPRDTALGAIELYQRHVSPYKGFCCAYRVHTGHASCSALGKRAIRLYGLGKGLGVLRQRLYLCGVAHRRFGHTPAARPLRYQRGDCDVGGCDFSPDCDLPSGKSIGRVCDWLSCCGDLGSCDWPSSRRKKKDERDVRLPPQRGLGRRP
jgi:putative component of membrane protein insertase Oxa1/YidC/SpoIIIJ protein YidD